MPAGAADAPPATEARFQAGGLGGVEQALSGLGAEGFFAGSKGHRVVVTTMLNAASDILDLPEGRPKQEKELVDNFVRQLRLVFLGARRWREG